MSLNDNTKSDVYALISELLENNSIVVTDDMPLIGGESLLNSMKLIELCLLLEDKATDMGFEFDWTSETAMSQSRSMFRTAGSLVSEFLNQMESRR